MSFKEIVLVDSNSKIYEFSVKKLPAFQWFELFEKLLKLLDHAGSDGDEVKKILHIISQSGKFLKDDIEISLDKENSEFLLTIVSVFKNTLLKSSFDEHTEIYKIIMSSILWEGSPIDFNTFDQFENKFLFYKLIFEVLGVHYDFLQQIQDLLISPQ